MIKNIETNNGTYVVGSKVMYRSISDLTSSTTNVYGSVEVRVNSIVAGVE